MPTKKAAYKAVRSDIKKHERNRRAMSELRTRTSTFEKLIADKKIDEAKAYFKAVSTKYQKTAAKGIIKKKTASRKISRLAIRLNKIAK